MRLRESIRRAWVPTVEGPIPSLEPPKDRDEGQIADFTIFDAKGSERPSWLDADIKRKKGGAATGDAAVDGAYESIKKSLVFYLMGLGINSLDAQGMAIKAAVHIGKDFNNAFYVDGKIHFGDGDGKIFHNFAEDLTVVAHELGHGIVELVLGGLTYWSQSGALNEAIVDILGVSALQFALGQQADENASWLVGELAMVPYTDQAGKLIHPALRSMKAPGTAYVNHPQIGTDPQPPSMDKLYTGPRDNYGVHINSGIINRAFYLTQTALAPKGMSPEIVTKIFLEAVKTLNKNTTFKEFAGATLEIAWNLYYQKNPEIHEALTKAWNTVKVLGEGAIDNNPPAFEITSPEVAESMGIDLRTYAKLQIRLTHSDLSDKPGVKKFDVGFVLDRDGKASLVVMAYVGSEQTTPELPEKFEGYKVVQMTAA